MLPSLHTAIATLFARGGLPPEEVDVRFERPERRWVESLARPTLGLFLFDLAESAEFRNAGAQVTRGPASATTRLPPRRFDLRFLVAAFASAAEHEQDLLWHALAVLLKYPTLPIKEVWPAGGAEPETAILTKVGAYQDAPRTLDLWGGLDLPPRPSLIYTVTAPLDLSQVIEAPLVFTRLVRTTRTTPEAERAGRGFDPDARIPRAGSDDDYAPRARVAVASATFTIAGTVRDQDGRPIAGVSIRAENHTARHEPVQSGELEECRTDAEGRFRLDNLARGRTRLWLARPGASPLPAEIDVPGIYDLTLY